MKAIIEITSTQLEEFSGISAKNAKPYHIRNQAAYLFKEGDKYPTPMKITLRDTQPPYAPGRYYVSDDSLTVDRNGRLSLYDLKLVSVPVAKAS